MTARVLVVDDVPANAKVLEARLSAEYFQVTVAASGAEALRQARSGAVDIILLDVMMPAMDGFEVCRRLKADVATMHIPVVIVTALDSVEDRVRGLEAGADDFLTKPVNDLALVTRIRSLARLKLLADELGARAASAREAMIDPTLDPAPHGRILLIDDRPATRERIVEALAAEHSVLVEADANEGLFKAVEGDFDAAIISLGLQAYDGLRLVSQLRALERTRMLPIIVLEAAEGDGRVLRAIDIGASDYVRAPVEPSELRARIRTQIRRKRYSDQLRNNHQLTIEMAITDSLTGLHNRRYFERHLGTLVEQATSRTRSLSLLVIDIDHFKAINDTYGHAAGDAVLRDFADRMRGAVRGIDLTARFGGEEFALAMPDTDARTALTVAERIRDRISREPFAVTGVAGPIAVTVSIGISSVRGPNDTPALLLQRGDEALYRAKHAGRNRVAPAA